MNDIIVIDSSLPINRPWALEIHGPGYGLGVYTKPFVRTVPRLSVKIITKFASLRVGLGTRLYTIYRVIKKRVRLHEDGRLRYCTG